MHPAQSRRLKHERHEREGTPLPVHRNGEQVATLYRAHQDHKWRGYDMAGEQIGTPSRRILDAELSVINVVKGREVAA